MASPDSPPVNSPPAGFWDQLVELHDELDQAAEASEGRRGLQKFRQYNWRHTSPGRSAFWHTVHTP